MYRPPERFQAMEYGWRKDGTRVRWWSWAPVRDALSPEVRMGQQKGLAYAERLKGLLDQGCEFLVLNPTGHVVGGTRGSGAELEIRGWLDVVIESARQNLGMPEGR